MIMKRLTNTQVLGRAHLRLIGRFYSSKFSNEFKPSPPKLPKEEQEEFEALQKVASSQIAIEDYNDRIRKAGSTEGGASLSQEQPQMNSDIGGFQVLKTIPEFEGDVNPKTGERGGPKQDPLKHSSDWSFNGRVTDF
ncbi:uncharacterized protein PRCAT00003450001 [Priceomyces carsonii]|uniref:uncharacterized protein n=1 Tax=Priceomyces carsonii TaxID=28549 RepID=UPI002ED7A2DF|nr:unnamed protein product [Priceomyces carsonii]